MTDDLPTFTLTPGPEVVAEMNRPRGRGRPSSDPDAKMWRACLRLYSRRHDRDETQRINRDVLESRRKDIADQRRGALHLHRADRRDDDQRARRALVGPLVRSTPIRYAQALATWIKRNCTDGGVNGVSVRTLRADIGALRKAGSATHR